MKSLNQKIGVVVLSGALLIEGAFVSGKSFVHANDISLLNELSYYLKFDVIDDNYNGDKDIDVSQFGMYYGVDSLEKVKNFDYNEFIYKLEKKQIPKGMYIVDFGNFKALIGVNR